MKIRKGKDRKTGTQGITKVMKKGNQLRDEYLDKLADVQELKGNKHRAAIIRNIRKVEELNLTFGHIKYAK